MGILTGLHQPLVLGGGNFAINYVTISNLSLEASFGISLDYANILSDPDTEGFQSVTTPFSYGFGVGYFYKGFSVNLEPKGTMFHVEDYVNQEVRYTTWSLGLGVYYNVFVWEGLFFQPSVRYWQKVGSTLSGGEVMMTDNSGILFTHVARKPGSNGWIYGVSLGWFFQNRKN